MSRMASSPSSVNSSRPRLSRSSRPTGKSRRSTTRSSVTVGRPRESPTLVNTPGGLFIIRYVHSAGGLTARPSTVTRSTSGSTCCPVMAGRPLTRTWPPAISRSALRRDATHDVGLARIGDELQLILVALEEETAPLQRLRQRSRRRLDVGERRLQDVLQLEQGD